MNASTLSPSLLRIKLQGHQPEFRPGKPQLSFPRPTPGPAAAPRHLNRSFQMQLACLLPVPRGHKLQELASRDLSGHQAKRQARRRIRLLEVHPTQGFSLGGIVMTLPATPVAPNPGCAFAAINNRRRELLPGVPQQLVPISLQNPSMSPAPPTIATGQ